MKLAIRQLTEDERDAVRDAAAQARRYYPNDGGTSPREAIRLAFRTMRNLITQHRCNVFAAAGQVTFDTARYEDM